MNEKRMIARRLGEKYVPMSNDAIEELASILIPLQVDKNELVTREGEICDRLFYVEKGFIRLFYYKNGKDLTEHFAWENDVFINIVSSLKNEPTRLIVEAIEPSKLYGIPYNQLVDLMHVYAEIGNMNRRMVEAIVIDIYRRIDSLRLEMANERYQRFLKEYPEVVKRAPLGHIASYLLMSPETLSRVRAGMVS
jgi:CRP-like cAMP-binding protein